MKPAPDAVRCQVVDDLYGRCVLPARHALYDTTHVYPLKYAAITELPWARWWHRRCQARKEPGDGAWGRCELRRRHDADHALERGMDLPRWSTEWTA